MKLNLDQYVDLLLPWDFVVTLGDVDFATRPATVGDLAAIQAMNGDSPSMEKMIGVMKSFFVEPAPQVSAWSAETLVAAMTGYAQYVTDRAKKNAVLIQEAKKQAAK